MLINFSISCGHGSFSASLWSFIAWHTYYEPFNYQLPDLISSEYHYLLINKMWTGEGDLNCFKYVFFSIVDWKLINENDYPSSLLYLRKSYWQQMGSISRIIASGIHRRVSLDSKVWKKSAQSLKFFINAFKLDVLDWPSW